MSSSCIEMVLLVVVPLLNVRDCWRYQENVGAMGGRDWQKARTIAVLRSLVSPRVVYKEST